MMGFSRFFGVVVLNKSDDETRFGVIISKKISKKAVDRNKIKRRLTEVLARNLENFETGKRILFLAKKEVLEVKPEEIKEELGKIFPRINKP